MIKAVLDSNVVVSALIKPKGKPAQILDQLDRFDLFLMEHILEEARRILNSRRIRRKYYHPPEEIDQYLDHFLRTVAELVPAQHVENVIPEDPPDNVVLAGAVDNHARYLVSGNKHFLRLVEYRGVKMVTPAQFLEILAAVRDTP